MFREVKQPSRVTQLVGRRSRIQTHTSWLKLKFFTTKHRVQILAPREQPLPIQTVCGNKAGMNLAPPPKGSREISGQWVSPWLREPAPDLLC